jgi:DNA polymerase-3 subunit delta
LIESALVLFRKDQSLLPVIVVIPGDPLILSWTFERIQRFLFLSRDDLSVNTEHRAGGDLTAADLLALAKEKPLFGPRRLFWVTQAEKVDGLLEKGIGQALLSAARKGNTTVVLEMGEKKASLLADIFPVFRTEPSGTLRQRQAEALSWVHILAEKKGTRLENGVAETLLRAFPEQMGQISSFLDRLSAPESGKIRTVTREDLKQHGLEDPLESVFRLFDAWEANDRRLYGQWERFIDNGQSPLSFLSLWHRQWRLYAIAREEIHSPSDVEKFATKNRIPPPVAEKIRKTARSMTRKTLREGYALLRETDLSLKSGGDPSLIMLRFLAGMSFLSPGKRERHTEKIRTGR